MTDPRKPWEPDERSLGKNWAAMFEPKGREAVHSPPPTNQPVEPTDTGVGADDAKDRYRPWLLQRGGSRPALMLTLRRFDLKSGQWMGWSMPYPGLLSMECIGERMISLDFGTRIFVVEGRGLDALAERLQQGVVLAIVEYAASIWPSVEGAIVTAVQCLGQT